MGYAVEIYFDHQTEQSIWDLRHALIEQGISSIASSLGDKPHISLAGFSNVDCDILCSLVQEYAKSMEPFKVQMSAIGTFPTSENVLFLAPVSTSLLLNYHQKFHHRLDKSNLVPSSYYAPENWMPHCTVEINIPDGQLPKAIDICKNAFKSLLGTFQEIGVIEFLPIKHLATWPLTAETHKKY
jgi:2'-5' RNA ligase